MKTKRDGWFWFAVGALALGTALSTAHCYSPPAHGQSLRPSGNASAVPQRASRRQSPPDRAERSASPVARQDRSRSRSSHDEVAAKPRQDPDEVRRILTEHVLNARQRQQRDAGPPDPALDEASRMPLMAMSWQQYRTWVKFADALAERDYRAVDLVLGDMKDSYDESTREILIDSLIDDYRSYLADVIESECEGLEPQSLWRKILFMSLLLAKLERQSVELGDLEQQAQRACGF